MVINTTNISSLSQANRDFGSIVRLVEYNGYAVIMKYNEPKFLVLAVDSAEEALEELGFSFEKSKFKA